MKKIIDDLVIEYNFNDGPFVEITSKNDKSESYTINFWDSDSDTLEYSANVKVVSEFASTACKAMYKCRNCNEPFHHFKQF